MYGICQICRATLQALWGPLGMRLRWQKERIELIDERQSFHPRVRAAVLRGRPQERKVRIENAQFW